MPSRKWTTTVAVEDFFDGDDEAMMIRMFDCSEDAFAFGRHWADRLNGFDGKVTVIVDAPWDEEWEEGL